MPVHDPLCHTSTDNVSAECGGNEEIYSKNAEEGDCESTPDASPSRPRRVVPIVLLDRVFTPEPDIRLFVICKLLQVSELVL
jgi:hypothetical protein